MPVYVDIELAKAAMEKAHDEDVELYGGVDIVECFPAEDAINILNTIPSADVEPVRHGHWEYHKNVFTVEGTKDFFECSACQAAIDEEVFDLMYEYGQTRRCGACGARMDEEEKS